MSTQWSGVFPAVTTKFDEHYQMDYPAMERHFRFMVDSGVHGLVVTGTLGENGVLSPAEKIEVLRIALEVAGGEIPVLAGVAENTTAAAGRTAEQVAEAGGNGIMLLPPMLYPSNPRETSLFFRTVASATDLPIMVYNNPVSYKVDITPEMFAEFADVPTFVAIKESSDDLRRIGEIINLTGERYRIFTGVDNLAMESLLMGACGWVAGLVCAFPRETVAIYRLIQNGQLEEARRIYRWFLPLLKLDVSTKLVQNIKLAEAMVGVGGETVRPPRLPLTGAEREQVKQVIEEALKNRPKLDLSSRL